MGRLLGLGFLFGAKDKGTTRVTKDLQTNFDDLGESVESVGKKTGSLLSFGNAINALNFLQLNRMSDAMQGLADKAGIGTAQQATQMETWGIQFGKAYREATAGMGDMRKEVDKYRKSISGVSFSLEVDAGEMTKTIALITKSGNALEDYGLGVREVGGLMQAGILNGEQLANVLTSLSNSYNLGAKGAGELVDQIAALGRETGAGADAIRVMPEALKAIDAAMGALPEGMQGNVQDMLKSLTVLAASTQKVLGGPYEDSFQAATDVMQKMTESRMEMARTFTGLGGEFPELASRLAESYGSIDKAFEMMSSDPAQFIMEIQKVYASLDETRRFRLLEQLPDSIKFMVKAGAEGAKVIEGLRKPIEGTSGALGTMAKGASGSTRTFAEQMELLKDRYETQLRGMTSVTRREVYQRTRGMYDKLAARMKEMSKDKGALGVFMRAWLNIRQFGFVQGIIPVLEEFTERKDYLGKMARGLKEHLPLLEEWGGALLDVAKAVAPLAIGLYAFGKVAGKILPSFGTMKTLLVGGTPGKVGGLFGMLRVGITALMGPWGLLAAAAVAAGVLIYKNWDKIGPMLDAMWQVLKTELAPAFEIVKEVATELWANLKTGVTVIWNDYLKPFGRWVLDSLPAFFGGATVMIMKSIAYLEAGMRMFGIKAAASIEMVKRGWAMLVAYVQWKVWGAFDKVGGIFSKIAETWNMSFLKIKRWFAELMLDMLGIIDTIAQKIPEGLRKSLGLDVLTAGVSKSMEFYRKEGKKLDKEIKETERDIAFRKDVERARERDRERKFAQAQAKLADEGLRHDKAIGEEKLKLSKKLAHAEKVGAEVTARTGAALEKARAEEKEEAPRKRGRRRRRRERGAEEAAAERAAASAEAEFVVRGRGGKEALPLSDFMKTGDVSLSKGGEKQMSNAMFEGVLKAQKKLARGPRGSAPGGGMEDLVGS